MAYIVENKDVSPQRVIQITKDVLFTDLKKTAIALYKKERENLDNGLIALIHEPSLKTASPVTVAYPLKKLGFPIDENLYSYSVLPRVNVYSILHTGDYDQLYPSIDYLIDYLEENNHTPIYPVRVIFHKSEKYRAIIKRNTKDYVTEIQISVE